MSTFRLKNMMTSAVYDTSSISDVCCNSQKSLKYGVKETVKWIKQNNSK